MEKDRLAFHLNLVAESLYIVKEAKYSHKHFEKVEINITLLEGELDSLEVSKSISRSAYGFRLRFWICV